MMTVPLTIWVWFCVYLNLAGWFLSGIRQLNAAGYAAALLIFCLGAWIFRRELFADAGGRQTLGKKIRRCRRCFPSIFFGAAGLVFLGGLLHAPNNYDALTYRLPRILNWLAAGHWLWIPTINDRMNYSAPAWEWLAAPQFALLHSDRALFLINVAGFFLLPGLLFSVFRQAGVRRRVAWVWMWLLPLAWGYVLQAGGLGNDLTGTVFCLASVHFGLRARQSGRAQDVCLALLSAALMTGIKMSNLPLALPCLVAVWPALPSLRRSLPKSFAVAVIALVVSAAPIMVLNQIYCGRWSGDPQNASRLQAKNPLAALFGNSLQLVQASLLPPVLPAAQESYKRMNEMLPASWHAYLHREFPRYYLGNFQELPSEEGSGLGVGVSLTLAVVVVLGLRRMPKINWTSPATGIALAAWVASAAYMTKMASEGTARLLLPYYALLILPLLKLEIQARLLRHRAWRCWLLLVALSVSPAVILSPSRPLWPAQTFSKAWSQRFPDSRLARRVADVYAGYASRNDALAPLREALPPTATKIGLIIGSNDAEYSFWRPFGERTAVCLRDGRNASGLFLPKGIEWLVVHKTIWNEVSALPLEEWATLHRAKIILTLPIVTFVKRGPEDWCLLHLNPPGNPSS
jgi:hypothetical protein